MNTQSLYKMVQENFPSIIRPDNLETYGTSDEVKASFEDHIGTSFFNSMMEKLSKEWNTPLESLEMTVNNANDGAWTPEFQILSGAIMNWDLSWYMVGDQKHYTDFQGLETNPELHSLIESLEKENEDPSIFNFFPTKLSESGDKQEWEVQHLPKFKVAQVFYKTDDWSDVYMVYSTI